MEDQSLLKILISWFPMLLLIAVWIFYMRRYGHGTTQKKTLAEFLEEARRTNQFLERIAASLEKR